jgi:hypothetical protein
LQVRAGRHADQRLRSRFMMFGRARRMRPASRCATVGVLLYRCGWRACGPPVGSNVVFELSPLSSASRTTSGRLCCNLSPHFDPRLGHISTVPPPAMGLNSAFTPDNATRGFETARACAVRRRRLFFGVGGCKRGRPQEQGPRGSKTCGAGARGAAGSHARVCSGKKELGKAVRPSRRTRRGARPAF